MKSHCNKVRFYKRGLWRGLLLLASALGVLVLFFNTVAFARCGAGKSTYKVRSILMRCLNLSSFKNAKKIRDKGRAEEVIGKCVDSAHIERLNCYVALNSIKGIELKIKPDDLGVTRQEIDTATKNGVFGNEVIPNWEAYDYCKKRIYDCNTKCTVGSSDTDNVYYDDIAKELGKVYNTICGTYGKPAPENSIARALKKLEIYDIQSIFLTPPKTKTVPAYR